MKVLLIFVIACVWAVHGENVIKCRMKLVGHTCSRSRNGRFFVDGNKITAKFDDDKYILNCNHANVLDSPAMPHCRNELHVPNVEFHGCPLPAENTLDAVLTYYYVKPQPRDGESSLLLSGYTATPELEKEHFTDLEYLTSLELKPSEPVTVKSGTFALLKNLKSLRVNDLTVVNVTDGTAIQSILTTTIQKLQLVGWKETVLAPLGGCDSLVQLDLFRPDVEQLPERWLAGCPVLEKLTLKNAEKIYSFPQKLFEGASSLRRISIVRAINVVSLPERFLDGVTNLMSFEMSHGRLKTISSDMFRAVNNLQHLTLSYNKLNTKSVEAISSLTSLTKLDLSQNSGIMDLCDENGYSSLRSLINLSELSLWQTNVNRICRDWREDLVYLQEMDLRATMIDELTFNDLIYKRNTSQRCVVNMEDCSITTLRFTEDDYKKVMAGIVNHPVAVKWDYEDQTCNCDMYWTRKALEDKPSAFNSVFPFFQLRCSDDTLFMEKPYEKICPEKVNA